jgi:hypothetical protein
MGGYDAPKDFAVERWRRDPDVRWMERARAGEIGAFEILFRKYSAIVAKVASPPYQTSARPSGWDASKVFHMPTSPNTSTSR